jgi:hypothetical protein
MAVRMVSVRMMRQQATARRALGTSAARARRGFGCGGNRSGPNAGRPFRLAVAHADTQSAPWWRPDAHSGCCRPRHPLSFPQRTTLGCGSPVTLPLQNSRVEVLIEGKALTVHQEIRRLHFDETARWRRSRRLRGLVYAPVREWSQMVIDEMELFPKGRIGRPYRQHHDGRRFLAQQRPSANRRRGDGSRGKYRDASPPSFARALPLAERPFRNWCQVCSSSSKTLPLYHVARGRRVAFRAEISLGLPSDRACHCTVFALKSPICINHATLFVAEAIVLHDTCLKK